MRIPHRCTGMEVVNCPRCRIVQFLRDRLKVPIARKNQKAPPEFLEFHERELVRIISLIKRRYEQELEGFHLPLGPGFEGAADAPTP